MTVRPFPNQDSIRLRQESFFKFKLDTLKTYRNYQGDDAMVYLQFRLRIFIGFLIVIIVTGTLGFRFTEGLSLVDAFYFSIVTIATVGYGDIHPSTEAGNFLQCS